jgi:hypothetical protein
VALAKSKAWFLNHRALAGASAFTLLLGAFVADGRMQPGRAAVALCFCWMLALHSEDINDHKAEAVEAFERLAQAGIDERKGERAAAARELLAAGQVAETIVREVQTERVTQVKAAGVE